MMLYCLPLQRSATPDPQPLICFQANPELQERQREQQKEEQKAVNAPKDLRDVLNKKKQKSKLD